MSKCPILRPVHVSVHSSRLVGKISVDGSTLAVADSWTTVAARLARAKEKKVPHFTLHVSVIPQNVDPWGWVKYFKEGASKNKNKGQLKLETTTNRKSKKQQDTYNRVNRTR